MLLFSSMLLIALLFHGHVNGYTISFHALKYGNVLNRLRMASQLEVTTYVPIEILDNNAGRFVFLLFRLIS